ncbi:MAG TPA: NAD(P)H-dependent oxidoreductase subunit E, partial [Minicystis sp.]|nr:NAD(P)H-dependent oxidoreductase subunit E [Minicystis sp.]
MSRILDALTALQRERGHLGDDDLARLAERLGEPLYRLEGLVSFYPHFRRTPCAGVEVAVCRDATCRLAAGGDPVARVRAACASRAD